MKNLSRILSGFLIFAMFLCMVPGYMGPTFSPAYAEVFTGEFEGFTYYFDDETGTLVIDGEGPMPSFEGRMAPWSVYSDKVAHVILNEGITSVSANAFTNFTRMEKVTLPETIAAVDSAAFTGCAQIKSVEYTGEPAKLQEILAVSQVAEIAAIPVTAVSASAITEKIGELTEKAAAAAAAAPEAVRPIPVTNRADTDRGASNDRTAPSAPSAPSSPSQELNDGSSNDAPAPSEPNQGQPEMPQAKNGIFYSVDNNRVSITIEKYEGGKLVSSEKYYEGFIKSTTYKYDGDKLLSEFTTDGTDSTTTTVYEYDGDRVIRTRSLYKPYYGDTVSETITDFQYEGNKRIETEINKGRKNGITYVRHYDGDQLVLEESYSSSGGTLRNRTTTNVNGSVTTSVKEVFDSDGSVKSKETTEKTFDENGRILQKTTTDNKNGKTQTTVEKYTYQLDGNKVIACETKNDHSENTIRFSYTYDGDMITGLKYTYVNSDGSSSPRTHEASFSYTEGMLNRYALRTDDHTSEYTIGRTNGVISSVNSQNKEDGKLLSNTNVKFDNQQIVSSEESYYNTDGQINSQVLHNYKYNDDGSLAARKIRNQNGENVITYDTTYVGDKKTTYIRDEDNGVLVNESESVTVNGMNVSYWDIRYGSKGKTILTQEYDEKGRYLGGKSETYNNDNVRTHSDVETYTYTDNGRRIVRNSVEYDETGKQKSAESNESFYTDVQQLSGKTTYYDANNAVLSSKIDEYEYYEAGQQSRHKQTKYDSAGNILSLSDRTYAENGSMIKEHRISAELNQEKTETETLYENGKTKNSKTTYYDANNAVQSSEIYEYEYYNQETHQKSRDIYTKYDSAGNILSISDRTYAENGNTIKELQINANNQQEKTETEILYGDNNAVTKWTHRSYNGNTLVSLDEAFYRDGNVVGQRSTHYDADGNIDNTTDKTNTYNELGEVTSYTINSYDGTRTKISTSTRTFNADQTSTQVTETYNPAGIMTEKISTILDADSNNIEQVTETYDNGATEPSTVHKYIHRTDGTLSSTEEKIFNEDRSYSVSITNYDENGQPSDTSTKNYNSDGTEKTEPIEQSQPLTTNANSVKMLTAGIRPQLTHNLDLDSATDNNLPPIVQEQSDIPNTVTDGSGILNGAPSAGTMQLSSLPTAAAIPQADNIPAASTSQQPDNVPAADVTPQLNYTPYDAPVTMKTTKGDVNVRKSPDTSSDLLGPKKTKDEIVKVVGETADGWYVLENNGYIKAEFLNKVNITEYDTPMTLNVSADNVFIRKGPGQSFDSQDKVNTGTTVSVVSYSDDGWYKLSNGGYIYQDFVTDQPLSTGISSGTSVPQETVTTSTVGSDYTDVAMFQVPVYLKVSAETADILTGPASGYAVVRTLQKGEKLTAYGRLADWYLIDQTNYHFVNEKLVEHDINSETEENKNTDLEEESKTEGNQTQEKDDSLKENGTPKEGSSLNENSTPKEGSSLNENGIPKEGSSLNENVTPEEVNTPKENEAPVNNTATPSEATPAA